MIRHYTFNITKIIEAKYSWRLKSNPVLKLKCIGHIKTHIYLNIACKKSGIKNVMVESLQTLSRKNVIFGTY